MKNGIVKLGTKRADKLGFMADKFDGWLWKKDAHITISFIISKQEGTGNLRTLFDNIIKAGYGVKVPTPSNRMRAICKKLGFKKKWEYDKNYEENVEIYYKDK